MSIRIQPLLASQQQRDTLTQSILDYRKANSMIITGNEDKSLYQDTGAFSLSDDSPCPLVYLIMFTEDCSVMLAFCGYWYSNRNYSVTSGHNRFFVEINANAPVSWFTYNASWKLAKTFLSFWLKAVDYRENTLGLKY